MEVQNVISLSLKPKSLYMIADAADRATNGKPIANQVVGIQVIGCFLVGGVVSTQSYINDEADSEAKLIKNFKNYLMFKYFFY